MRSEECIYFDRYCLDLANEALYKDSQPIRLRPKAFSVLSYLLIHPGQLITKEVLLDSTWPGVFVGDAVLKVAIRQIREALDDAAATPRFIETAHRRGYRFIGRVSTGDQTPSREVQIRISKTVGPVWQNDDSTQRVVGRDQALSRMRGLLDKALRGERQIVFVTGEAGIGKTVFADTFVRTIPYDGRTRIARGQCLEQYGTAEAYLPILDAIGRLCREQEEIVQVLRSHAPMWLLQLPSLLTASERERLGREVLGSTRERMLREMGEALEVLTAEVPLVLVLEDLHWADYSTIDLISYLARQRHAARMMLIGTYRPVELFISGHPLYGVKRDLLAKQQCEELQLEYLSEEAVAKYLSVRFPVNRFPAMFACLLHHRTDGNPLFMVNVVDYLVAEGVVDESQGTWELAEVIGNIDLGVPDSIKQMIQKQLEHRDAEEQRILQAASAAGLEFTAPTVAAGLGERRAAIESRCDELARQCQFIQDLGVQQLPDGETVARYGFVHVLYQNVLYEGLSSSMRIHLHRRIGQHMEQLYNERATEIAAELAMHFERGGNFRQAAKYLYEAAKNDLHRFAYHEAMGLSRRGLELVAKMPETPDSARTELGLLITLGVPLIATEGYASPAVGRTYTRARELCRHSSDVPEISQVLWGLWTFHLVKAELRTALENAQEFVCLAGRVPYSELAMEVTLIHLGDFAGAIQHFEKVLSLYDPELHREDAFRYSQNSAVAAKSHAALALWFLGRQDEALKQIEEARNIAQELSDPHGLAHNFFFGAVLHQLRGDHHRALEEAERAIVIAADHGLMLYQATATIARGTALIGNGRPEEAVEEIRAGLAAYHGTGTELLHAHWLALLAEALHTAGQTDEAVRIVNEALALTQRNGDQYYQAELHRLNGEFLLAQATGRALSRAATVGNAFVETERSQAAEAANCFEQAIKIAERQNARSLQLRAVTSLARLYKRQGKGAEVRQRLAQIYGGFSQGFDTRDLRDARTLLDELSERASVT